MRIVTQEGPGKGGNHDSETRLPGTVTSREAGLVLPAGAGYPDARRRLWGWQQHEQQSNTHSNKHIDCDCPY
jgi:hypothetical protein